MIKHIHKFFAAAFAATALVVLVSCATVEDGGQFSYVATTRTPLFMQGPHQTTPPDEYLGEGTRLRLLSPAGEYAEIETVRGKRGFVSLRDIKLMQ